MHKYRLPEWKPRIVPFRDLTMDLIAVIRYDYVWKCGFSVVLVQEIQNNADC